MANYKIRLYGHVYLLVHCNLTEKEKDKYLKKSGYSLYYYAALGDTSALNKLISQFKKCKNHLDYRRYARQLARIGNKECIEVLLRSLNDTLTYNSNNGVDTLFFRLEVLCALKYVFPDEVLFTLTPHQIYWYGTRSFEKKFGKGMEEEYLKQVEEWVFKYNGSKLYLHSGKPLAKYGNVP